MFAALPSRGRHLSDIDSHATRHASLIWDKNVCYDSASLLEVKPVLLSKEHARYVGPSDEAFVHPHPSS